MFDTHCHFNLEEFQDDLEDVVRHAQLQGVNRFLVPGVDFVSSQRAVAIAEAYPGVIFAAIGIHPNYSSNADATMVCHLIEEYPDQVIAIGEIGLDYYRTYATKDEQVKMLEKMLSLANSQDLPICIHNRDADQDLLSALSRKYSAGQQPRGKQTGVFHAYDGSEVIGTWGLEHGFYFGIGGAVTYKKSDALRESIPIIGLDHLVLETDSPYLTPAPHRGQRNTPANLKYIVDAIAFCMRVSAKEVFAATDRNAQALFGFK